ncbi:hypothetical protein [Curtobacterium poinsettiae]|uniref:hypothetical protein n=1 Tax=Curtobacterium poinsettiae TaxID=159612 RepID=UPI00236156E3|nr:hypothetical protein [Curtobacterium flaccumfaciens]MDD1386009.1 hypothetical protein [Curtobacterium flaccumfaciens pv. poinsettiae]
MIALRILRIVGWIFVALGFGSMILRTWFNADTPFTMWMGGAQPYSGAAMGVVGVVIVLVAVSARRRIVARAED